MIDKEIQKKSELLEEFLQYADNSWNIPIWKIARTGLFDNLTEIEVFFFSFDGYYYNTDTALIKRLDSNYISMLDKMGVRRLYF